MRKTLAIGLLLTTSACAELTSIYHTRDVPIGKARIVTMDAKQRSVLMVPTTKDDDNDDNDDRNEAETGTASNTDGKPDTKKKEEERSLWRMCAEAAPDAFSALSASGSLAADAKSQSGKAAVALAETAGTIERTQTINLLRESLYRTCERYLSGALKRRQLVVQAARDQRSMVAILAIEQLTRAARASATILTPAGTSSAVGNGEEQAGLIASFVKERADAKKALDEAVVNYDKIKANCISATIPADGATRPTPDEWTNCNKARSAASDRSNEYNAATTRLDKVLSAANANGVAAGAATIGFTPQGGGGGGIPDQATLSQIARSVERIALGSGLIGHSQKMTVAASATAEKKTVGQRS